MIFGILLLHLDRQISLVRIFLDPRQLMCDRIVLKYFLFPSLMLHRHLKRN